MTDPIDGYTWIDCHNPNTMLLYYLERNETGEAVGTVELVKDSPLILAVFVKPHNDWASVITIRTYAFFAKPEKAREFVTRQLENYLKGEKEKGERT